MVFILSQILVFVSDLFFIISMLNKKKNYLIYYLIVSNILFALHYLCLNAYTGATTIFVDVVYLIIIYFLEKKGKRNYNIFATSGAMILTILISVLTWDNLLSLLPMFAMLTYLTAMMFDNIIIVKSGSLVRNTLNTIYMFLISSYLGAVLGIGLIISTIIGIIMSSVKKSTFVNKNDIKINEIKSDV